MNDALKDILLSATNSLDIKEVELIQKLWSGYGEISRVHLNKNSVVLKYINLPEEVKHPRNWNTDKGHKRKIKSYEVETNWYNNFNSNIHNAYFPRLIKSGEIDNAQFILLEDLANKGFQTKAEATWKEVEFCLTWLAEFHRHHLNIKPQGLWDIGTYWHLDTRPDEYKAIEDLELKRAAIKIDEKLNSAKFQTIVHGDAKLANFLFNESQAAAIDYQYIGGGVGIKDVAYFLSSIYKEDDLFKYEQKALDYYFKVLNHDEIEKEWRELYSFAWADFYRFLSGWYPDHWKIHSYSKAMKDKVLKCL